MIKAAIFDLDGTLADTMDDLLTAMNRMLRDFGYAERSREELTRFINRGARYFVGRSLPDGTVDDFNDPLVDKALAGYSKHYSECYADKTRPFKGLPEEIAAMKKAGFKLGVLSNKQDAFVKKTAQNLYPDLFDSVHGQLDLPEKPDPAPALAVAAELGVVPEECAFIGDSDIDIKTGINSGMLPVGVTWGYRSEECLSEAGAHIMIRSTDKILSTLNEINEK